MSIAIAPKTTDGPAELHVNPSVLEEALKDFKRSVEITRDVRFRANQRLGRRQHASTYIVSLLSLYVIVLSLLPNILELKSYQTQILLACSIVLSVFVIVTSLIDGAQNFFHQGELLHHCARKIASILHDLQMIDPKGDQAKAELALEKLREQYKVALDECPINHATVDFLAEMANKPHLFPNQYKGNWRWGLVRWLRFRTFIDEHSWMILHLIAFVFISWVVYAEILVPAHFKGEATQQSAVSRKV
jgi:SMODS and SLOG-associating 2TM effector domain family 5